MLAVVVMLRDRITRNLKNLALRMCHHNEWRFHSPGSTLMHNGEVGHFFSYTPLHVSFLDNLFTSLPSWSKQAGCDPARCLEMLALMSAVSDHRSRTTTTASEKQSKCSYL
jgi:hypothetical protein